MARVRLRRVREVRGLREALPGRRREMAGLHRRRLPAPVEARRQGDLLPGSRLQIDVRRGQRGGHVRGGESDAPLPDARHDHLREFLRRLRRRPAVPDQHPARRQGIHADHPGPELDSRTGAPVTITAGTRLGPYEVLSPVGAGGMGEVYRAKDTRLERTVAVKVLPKHLSSSAEVRQRFEREAKTISQLSHPHICALYDVGNQDGVEYLVMEFLEGETLANRLLKGPLTAEQTLKYGIEIADALDKAHRQGIVHRDLKPGNVMLTKSGVKLLDFGLAKAVAPARTQSPLTSLPTMAGGANLTQEGTILGTFQYMAPEQLEGKETDARTDIFAFGTLLYEMATGKKAFAGASQASLIAAILEREPPPISTVQAMSPPALDRVVKTCLAKDPEDRFQTAHDVKLQLQWIVEGGSQAGAAAIPVAMRRKSGQWLSWAIAALSLAATVFFGVGYFRRAPVAANAVRAFLLPPEQATFRFIGSF